MAKGIPEHELNRLIDVRIETQKRIRDVRAEVEREFAPKIEDEVVYRTRAIERAFAAELVEAKENGATYEQRVKIVGTGKAEVMRHYIELGGGTVRKTLTGDERRAERGENLGVREIGHNRFIYTTNNGEEVEAYVMWRDHRPYLWADGTPVEKIMADLGDIKGLRKRGDEIVAAFGLTENKEEA